MPAKRNIAAISHADSEPTPTFNELPASKKVTLPALKIGPGGAPVHYHFYDGTLYINGRALQRRQG